MMKNMEKLPDANDIKNLRENIFSALLAVRGSGIVNSIKKSKSKSKKGS